MSYAYISIPLTWPGLVLLSLFSPQYSMHKPRPVNKLFMVPLKAHYREEIHMWLPHNNRSLSPFDNIELLGVWFNFVADNNEARPETVAETCGVNVLDPRGPATKQPAPDRTHPASNVKVFNIFPFSKFLLCAFHRAKIVKPWAYIIPST
jgi:hypothetical protein